MADAREANLLSLMFQDEVAVDVFPIGLQSQAKRTLGWVSAFDYHTVNRKGSGTSFTIRVTSEGRSEFEATYEIPKFPVRINDYAQVIASVPKTATLDDGLMEIRITRLSRPVRQSA